MSAPAPEIDLDGEFERRLISCLMIDVPQIERVRGRVAPSDFFDLRSRAVFEILLDKGPELSDPTHPVVDHALLAKALDERGELELVGGISGLVECSGLEAIPSFSVVYAREIKKSAVAREIRRYSRELDRHPEDAEAFSFLTERFEELRELTCGIDAQSGSLVGLTGPSLDALAAEADPESPLPGFLDPEPSLHILHGVAKTGKTTFAWLLGLAWATGRSPWEGAPRLPGSRVLILSGEQGTRKCLRVLRRITQTAELGSFEDWRDRVTIVGRRAEMSPLDRKILRLDEDGIDIIRRVLKAAEEAGHPFGLIIADSLSRLKPAGASTQDNDDMVGVLDPLAALSIEMGVYFLLIHHDGHNADRQGKAIDGVRGASAIRDVPQVLLVIARVSDNPRQRIMRVAGNELPDLTQVFEVATEWEPEGYINRFALDSDWALDVDSVFENGPLSLMEFGRRALGWAPDRAPSGGAKDKAKALLNDFENRGVIRKDGRKWRLVKD